MLCQVRSRRLARAAYFLLVAGCITVAMRLYRDRDRYDRQDFGRYYAEARELEQGGDPWLPSASARANNSAQRDALVYPPAFYLAFSPLFRLPRITAWWTWQALQLVSLLAAIAIVTSSLRQVESREIFIWSCAFAFLFPPLQTSLHWGQPTCLLLLLLAASWRCARTGRDATAGALLAAAALLKIFPAAVGGYFLVRARWKVVAAAVVCVIAISALLVAVYGVQRNLDFVHGSGVAMTWMDRRRNLSLIGNFHALLMRVYGGGPAPFLQRRFYVVAILAALTVVFVSAYATLPMAAEPAHIDGLCWSLWMLSSIIISPVAWDHYLVLLIPMYLFLAIELLAHANGGDNPGPASRAFQAGAVLALIGLCGFIVAPYIAVIRRIRLEFLFVMSSYAGVCLILRSRRSGRFVRAIRGHPPSPAAPHQP